MRENWLAELYQSIKTTRNNQISLAMSLLRKKAARDPEVAEALRLLHAFASGQEQERNSMPMGHANDRNEGYNPEGGASGETAEDESSHDHERPSAGC